VRRIALILGSLAAAGAIVVATAGADGNRTYQAKLFNAFGLVDGSELRVAGVKAGTVTDLDITAEKTALITFEVGPDFPELKADASCSSEPQSLIAEYFLDCQPGSSDQPLEAPIEAAKNQTTVQNDLVQNTLREPFKRRFQLIINEFGTALVGNAENLNAAIRSGAPALREFRKVLKILGRQNTIIAQLNVDSDNIFAKLTDRREDVVRFIDEAEDTARVSAERRVDLSRDFDLLDDFLFELRPVMHELGNLAREQTPLLTDLGAAAPGLNKLARNLPRFNNGARVSLEALGGATEVGRRALVKGQDEIAQLSVTSQKAPPAAQIIAEFLQSLDDPANAVEEDCDARTDLRDQPGEADRRVAILEAKVGNLSGSQSACGAGAGTGNPGYTGLEGLLNYGYIQTNSLNLFDAVGHGLHFTIVGAPEVAGECGHTNGEQDWVARTGGGETINPVDAADCVGVLGDFQPGITVGKTKPWPSNPADPNQFSLTGNLSRYDPRVCPLPGGSTDLDICNPADPPHMLSARQQSAAEPSQSSVPGAVAPPSQEKINEALDKLKKGELPSQDDLREALGLPPGAALPPEITGALGATQPSPDSAAAGDLLDFLFGP